MGNPGSGGLRWSEDGRYLAFQSTRRNGRSNDIWLMDFNEEKEGQADRGIAGWFLVGGRSSSPMIISIC